MTCKGLTNYIIDTKIRQEYAKYVMNTQAMIGLFYAKYNKIMSTDFKLFIIEFHKDIDPSSHIRDYGHRNWFIELLYTYMENRNYSDTALQQLKKSLAQIETLAE